MKRDLTLVGDNNMKVGNIACIFKTFKYFAAPLITDSLIWHIEIIEPFKDEAQTALFRDPVRTEQ